MHFRSINEDDEEEINMKDLLKVISEDESFNVFSIEEDYHSSRSVEDLKYNYGGDY
jgi:hypothetical protein